VVGKYAHHRQHRHDIDLQPSNTMKNSCAAFLFVALGLTTSTVFAQTHTPLPSIATATFDQYHGEYQESPLCAKDEITLWTCQANKRVFSLCSSRVATRTTGYLQYRASNAGKVTFSYPALKAPPLHAFQYHSFANGDASVEFSNDGYNYSLIDPLRGNSSILVSVPGASRKTTEIACGGNQTLQVNYTMRLMYDFGVWAGE
jgi:hypothetical protein